MVFGMLRWDRKYVQNMENVLGRANEYPRRNFGPGLADPYIEISKFLTQIFFGFSFGAWGVPFGPGEFWSSLAPRAG